MIVTEHLGALHPVEQLLTVLLAFGPFLVLGVVIAVRRRQDAVADDRSDLSDRSDRTDRQPQRDR